MSQPLIAIVTIVVLLYILHLIYCDSVIVVVVVESLALAVLIATFGDDGYDCIAEVEQIQ